MSTSYRGMAAVSAPAPSLTHRGSGAARFLPAALLLSACTTHLDVAALNGNAPPVLRGVPYALPALTYRVIVLREITGCSPDGAEPEVTATAEIERSYAPGEQFVIDPTRLSSWRKTIRAEVLPYPEGTLRSINVGMVDRSPEIAASFVKAGFSVARLAAGLPTAEGGGGKAATTSRFSCPTTMLKNIKDYTKVITTLTGRLQSRLEELAPLEQAAMLGALSEADKARATALMTDIAAIRTNIASATSARDTLRARLTLRQQIEVAPAPRSSGQAVPFDLSGDAAKRWLEPHYKPLPTPNGPVGQDLIAKLSLATVWQELPTAGVAPADCIAAGSNTSCGTSAIKPDRKGRIRGIAFRTPVQARLRVCLGATLGDCASGGTPPIIESVDAVPQLGRMVLLPLTNGFGEDTELVAEWATNGRLLKAKYESRRASGERAAEALGGGLQEAEAFAAARREARAARQAEADGALEKALAKAKTERDLLDAQTALTPDAVARSRRLADLEAEILQLEAEISVRKLRDELSTGGSDG